MPSPGRGWRIAAVLAWSAVVCLPPAIFPAEFSACIAAKIRKIMLAVLPFQNLTVIPNRSTCGRLTEEMIAQLGRLHPEQLGVIARTSVMGYKHGDQRLDQIGRTFLSSMCWRTAFEEAGSSPCHCPTSSGEDQSHLWTQDYDYRPRYSQSGR